MPIEIRELVIRAVVEERRTSAAEPQAVSERSDDDREALTQACVEQVLRILRRDGER